MQAAGSRNTCWHAIAVMRRTFTAVHCATESDSHRSAARFAPHARDPSAPQSHTALPPHNISTQHRHRNRLIETKPNPNTTGTAYRALRRPVCSRYARPLTATAPPTRSADPRCSVWRESSPRIRPLLCAPANCASDCNRTVTRTIGLATNRVASHTWTTRDTGDCCRCRCCCRR